MSDTFHDASRSNLDALGRLGLIARVLTTGTDAELFDAVLAQAVAAINATGGMLALLQPDRTLRIVSDTGYPADAVASFGVFTIDDELPASVAVRTRQPVWVPDLQTRLERFPALATRNTGQVASASLPLEFEGEVLGTLGVSFATEHAFTADERMFLTAVADQSATLLRLRELSEIGRRAGSLAGSSAVADHSELRRAEAAMSERVEREQRAQRQRRELEEAQRIARLGSWYWDAATNTVTWTAELYRMYGLPEGTPLDPELTLGALSPNKDTAIRLATRALESREPIVFDQALTHTDGRERITQVRMEADLDEVSGELRGMRGTTQDITELRTAQRTLDAATDQIEREREAIRMLQRTIMPSELPAIDGVDIATRYIGATRGLPQVGGDWFDAFTFEGGLVALTIGDVVGHGLSSVERMVQMRSALRMALVQSIEPHHAIDALESFTAQTLPGTYATAIACVFDPRTGILKWTRAGHLPFMVCRHDGTVASPLHARRPPIGTDSRPSPIGEMTLEPGDGVLLYTDGLVERREEAIDVGMGRLAARLVTTQVDAETICDAAVVACLDGREVIDDVCLLALARR